MITLYQEEGKMEKKYIDLHTHSTFSDGFKSVSELVEMAKVNDVGVFAIADHDDVRSYEFLRALAKKNNINFISAIEMSTYYINPADRQMKKIHLLGYGIDPYNSALAEELNFYRTKRFKENIQMLNNMLIQGIDVPNCIFYEVKFDNYLSIATEMRRVLYKNNYDEDFVEDFVAKIKPLVPKYKDYEIDVFDAIKRIKQSGGIPVLVHPHEIKMSFEDKDRLVKSLKLVGLKGVEVYCSEASVEETRENKLLADENGLLASVGSDYHRPDLQRKTIGKGINNNLCKTACSFVDYLQDERLLNK